jgi:hypothetical protein
MPRAVNQATIDLVKHFEGLFLEAYQCPAGVWTIGWGNTRYQDGRPVKENDKINRIEADMMLRQEVDRIAAKLAKDVPGWREITDNQQSALVRCRLRAAQLATDASLHALPPGPAPPRRIGEPPLQIPRPVPGVRPVLPVAMGPAVAPPAAIDTQLAVSRYMPVSASFENE